MEIKTKFNKGDIVFANWGDDAILVGKIENIYFSTDMGGRIYYRLEGCVKDFTEKDLYFFNEYKKQIKRILINKCKTTKKQAEQKLKEIEK